MQNLRPWCKFIQIVRIILIDLVFGLYKSTSIYNHLLSWFLYTYILYKWTLFIDHVKWAAFISSRRRHLRKSPFMGYNGARPILGHALNLNNEISTKLPPSTLISPFEGSAFRPFIIRLIIVVFSMLYVCVCAMLSLINSIIFHPEHKFQKCHVLSSKLLN